MAGASERGGTLALGTVTQPTGEERAGPSILIHSFSKDVLGDFNLKTLLICHCKILKKFHQKEAWGSLKLKFF